MDPIVQITVAYAFAVLWLTGAAHKIASPRQFRATLADYGLLPAGLALPAATIIVALELGLGIALLSPAERSVPLLLASGLLALYAAAIGLNLLRGRRYIDCGCSSPGLRQPLSAWLVARNLALAAAAALTGSLSVESRALTWLDIVTIVATVCIVAAMYTALNRLLANAGELRSLE